jgi:prepilin-type N-terminal cleavage/methylation domain-containing protein
MGRSIQKGFNLIELLIVIGIITILATIVLVSVNPGRQFSQARDTQRRSDLYVITNAVHQFSVENEGDLPASITATPTDIGTAGLNLKDDLVPTYAPNIPVDPSTGTPTLTGYVLFQEPDGHITASATGEIQTTITLTR